MNDATLMDRRTAPMPAPDAPGGALQAYRPAPAAMAMGDFLSSIATPAAIQQQKQFSALYDQACDALIGENDVQHEAGKTFKKKSAWRKLARFFQVSTEILRVEKGWRQTPYGRDYYYAEATVRATAPWGQSMEATAACDTLEPRFKSDKAKQKAGNDCLATAETRATNRAVSNLIAAGEVSAEEIEGGDHGSFERGRGDREQGNARSSGSSRGSGTTGSARSSATRHSASGGAESRESALVDRLRALAEEIRSVDAEQGAAAEIMVEDLVQRGDVSEAEMMKLGGQLRKRLLTLQEAKRQMEVGHVADLPAGDEAEMDAIDAALEQDAGA